MASTVLLKQDLEACSIVSSMFQTDAYRLTPFQNSFCVCQRCINGSPGLLALLLTAENKFALSNPAPPPTGGLYLLLSEEIVMKPRGTVHTRRHCFTSSVAS